MYLPLTRIGRSSADALFYIHKLYIALNKKWLYNGTNSKVRKILGLTKIN